MHGEGTNSRVKVFGNIFISFIGAGILGLPYAFKEVSSCCIPAYCQLIFVLVSKGWNSRRSVHNDIGRSCKVNTFTFVRNFLTLLCFIVPLSA